MCYNPKIKHCLWGLGSFNSHPSYKWDLRLMPMAMFQKDWSSEADIRHPLCSHLRERGICMVGWDGGVGKEVK